MIAAHQAVNKKRTGNHPNTLAGVRQCAYSQHWRIAESAAQQPLAIGASYSMEIGQFAVVTGELAAGILLRTSEVQSRVRAKCSGAAFLFSRPLRRV
jgi:hypothetical protein